MRKFETTAEIPVPEKLVDQIIGQEYAVKIVKKAAKQRRNVLLLGTPGTGKSMLAQAMAELMPAENMEDVLIYPNQNDENRPIVKVVKTYPAEGEIKKSPEMQALYRKAGEQQRPPELGGGLQFAPEVGQGRRVIEAGKSRLFLLQNRGISPGILMLLIAIGAAMIFFATDGFSGQDKWFLLAIVLGIAGLAIFYRLTAQIGRRMAGFETNEPKLIVDNTGNRNAPFVDATGAKAGALFGDVRHDPLQCFFPCTTTTIIRGKRVSQAKLSAFVDEMLEKYPSQVQREDGYEGLILPDEEEVYTLGFKDGNVTKVRIQCINRRMRTGKMRVVEQGENRLLVTPEHKVYAQGEYLEAERLAGNETLTKHEEPIITGESVIATFSPEEQENARNYYAFLKIKEANPKFGYKKIAKILGIKAGQTRWWNNKVFKPKAVMTVERLERLGLLPFYPSNKAVPAVARVLGTTFGDGGIFSTLNGIFLSSSEESSLNDYAADLISIFGDGIGKNFERRISGINNTGMVVWNTNRDVVRFFMALGAPVGRKNKPVHIPQWIHLSVAAEKEFFGALLGNELCSPRFSPEKKRVQCFAVGLAGKAELKDNRLGLLNGIVCYLNSYGVTTSPHINENEFKEGSYVWRLCISIEIENMLRFYRFIPVRYSEAKLTRIREAVENVLERKKLKSSELSDLGKSSKYIHSTLRVSDGTLQKIISGEQLEFDSTSIDFSGFVYNITTESGNLFANGILVKNSGGLGTPAHLRVESGAIHRANKGVLFIDEISSLKPTSQMDLLTAMQEKRFPITGRSEMSSGALVKTEPVPCDFVLVAAGNVIDLGRMHPALRSRIRGNGYEVFAQDSMEDTGENEDKLVQFVAQEVKKDGKIPHFARAAVEEAINDARRRAGRKKKLTLNLRELGGLVRAAGDIAREEGAPVVTAGHVARAKVLSHTLEQQISERVIEVKKDYRVFVSKGYAVGKVNGLAVMGDGSSGLVMPIVAEVTPASSRAEGKLIATGKLGAIAKEAVENVSAIIKKHMGKDVSQYDMHVQFLQTYEGVEGDSASVSIAVAVLSAMEGLEVDESVAMTGSLSVRGEVLPVGGVTAKVEAAIESGIREVIVPKANYDDIYLAPEVRKKVKVTPAATLADVLQRALKDSKRKKELILKMKGKKSP